MGDEADGQRPDTPTEPGSSSPPAVYTASPGSGTDAREVNVWIKIAARVAVAVLWEARLIDPYTPGTKIEGDN